MMNAVGIDVSKSKSIDAMCSYYFHLSGGKEYD